MAETKEIEIRSEELQELLGTAPSWIVRWGTSFIVLSIAALTAIGLLLRYPEIVQAPFVLGAETPPIAAIVRTDGYVNEIRVADNEKVEKGEVLVVLSNEAIPRHVQELENKLEDFDWIDTIAEGSLTQDTPYVLGQLQDEYNDFQLALENYRMIRQSGSDLTEVGNLKRQIDFYEKSIQKDISRKKDAEFQLSIQQKQFIQLRDRYRGDPDDLAKLQEARLAVAATEKEIKEIESDIEEKKARVTSLKNLISNEKGGRERFLSDTREQVENSLKKLKSAISSWNHDYLVTAPASGIVSFFHGDLRPNQLVRKGEEILTIIPQDEGRIVCTATLPVRESARVREGQKVLLRFAGYPYQEFGKVKGIVSYKAAVAKNDKIVLEIALPEGLATTKGKILQFEQQMVGTAEIITEEKSFFNWVFERIFP